ncbi:MAG: amidohydrolase family protein [Pseudomonadota bacterium]
MIIDAHQHFWRPERSDYGWLKPELTALYRDFQPSDLEPVLAAHGVDGTVIIQAAPTEAETHYLLKLASHWTIARAVVGWVDLTSGQAARSLEQLARNPLLRGVRPMIQDEPDPDWMLQPAVGGSLQALRRYGLTFDALVQPRHLQALKRLVDHHPELPVVIDHGGKPQIAAGAYRSWADDIRALSERPQVMCKLSGLPTEAGPRTADADLRPYVEHLLECFGPARLMWGSDWPVLTAVGDYGAWLGQAKRLVQSLSADEQAQIFGRTAARFYGIEEMS